VARFLLAHPYTYDS